MSEGIVELYSEADLAALERHIRRWSMAHILLAAAALAVILTLIALTGTANAARMELSVILVSTVAGWIVLYGQLLVVTPWRRELRHARMLRGDEREKVTGRVTVTDETVAITKSIVARRVEVDCGDTAERLLVCRTRADALAGVGEATLYVVHGYVAAYEVTA